jgi:hypothetical protein
VLWSYLPCHRRVDFSSSLLVSALSKVVAVGRLLLAGATGVWEAERSVSSLAGPQQSRIRRGTESGFPLGSVTALFSGDEAATKSSYVIPRILL